MISKTDNTRPLIVLEGLKEKNRFFTSNTIGQSPEDACKLDNGEVAYRLLAYCDTNDEAIAVIEGDGYDMLKEYVESKRELYEAMGHDADDMLADFRNLTGKDTFNRILRTSPMTFQAARNVHNT